MEEYQYEQIKLTDLLNACFLPVKSTKEDGYENTLIVITNDIINEGKLSIQEEMKYARNAIHLKIGVQKTDDLMLVVSGEETVFEINSFLNKEHIDISKITIPCVAKYVDHFDNLKFNKKKQLFSSILL